MQNKNLKPTSQKMGIQNGSALQENGDDLCSCCDQLTIYVA